MSTRVLTLRVARIVPLTPEVRAFELVHPRGLPLPPYTPGAHLTVHTPGGFARPYSLARAPRGGDAGESGYLIAVRREPAGRGGSAAMYDRVHEGDLLAVDAPRNAFPLRAEARRHLLLAGGIGLTPLLAMAEALARDGADFTLAVFARSRAHLAFADALAALGDRVIRHFDDPAAAARIDLGALLADRPEGAHLYLCGPPGFMAAARRAAAHWPDVAIHAEHFAPPSDDAGSHAAAAEPFTLRLLRRGVDVPVEAGQSAVAALRDIGIDVPTSCEQGVCGSCVVDWHGAPGAGPPLHRDHCLSATERAHRVALCCSRAEGSVLAVGL
jgi:vanillate O-demethylase ferredoxin subunit